MPPAVVCLLALLPSVARAQEPPAAPAPAAPIEDTPTPVPSSPPPGVQPSDPASLEVRIAALEAELAKQREETAKLRLQMIPAKDLEFDLDGYYRVRGHVYNHMFASQASDGGNLRNGEDYEDARLMTMRLRLQPKVTYKQLAKFYMQVDALDDVVWGDNQSLASTSLFAGDPSSTDLEGQPQSSLDVSRAWMEVTVPVGSIRAGRMISHWGMGLLANGGDGFDDSFGENHYGATYDRALFATRPIAVAQALSGRDDSNLPLFVAIGVDRLVEDPLYQYYGYQCEPDLVDGVDEAYDVRCDTRPTGDPDGTTDIDHSWVDDTRVSSDRTADWWADQDDDVMEMVYVLIWRGDNRRYFGAKGDLTAGVYFVNRVQRETDSAVWIYDAYMKGKNRGVTWEFEGLTIRGDTRAIVLSGADPNAEDPLYKAANIWGYVGRLGYERPLWGTTFETGYASGDENTADEDFTGRALHPDHNVGLILYEEVLARVTANGWSEGARGLWSNGGVYNSRYIFPTARVYPLENWELQAGALFAWPDRPDGAMIRTDADSEAALLGREFDFSLEHKWHEHVLMSLEAGFCHATDRMPLEAAGLNPEGNFFTFQSRLAYQF